MKKFNLDETRNDRIRKAELAKAVLTSTDLAIPDGITKPTAVKPGKKNYMWTAPKQLPEVTNATFAKTNDFFKTCCSRAGVENTPRQASKFRNKKGSAWNGKPVSKEGGTF